MPDIAGKLFPNLTTLIVQLLSTGVLLLIFKKYLWKNVMEYFAKRADYIESTINEAKEMNEKASANLETAEKEAREAASKYRDILDQAKDDGQKVKQQIIDQANEEARAKIEQAQKEIETEKKQAQADMKQEIVDVAIEVATKVMNKEMNEDINKGLVEEFVDEVLDKFQKGDMLLLQNEINKIDYIIEKAYKKGMCIIFNPSPYNDEIKNLDFNMLSYIIINEVEMSEFTQCDNPKDGLKYFAKNYPKLKIIITLGSEGSMYGDTEKVVFQPSFKVNAIDTTAAGDTFTGYFFAQTAMGNTVENSLKIASVASAIAVSRKGASVSIPMLNEVLATENLLPNS